MQMKATLCVFVALVAVTSAAPAFMQSNRRGACDDNDWCGTACKCDSDEAQNDCADATKYCSNVGASGVVTSACAGNGQTDGSAPVSGACSCGAATVTAPTAKMTAAAQGKFCLLNKPNAQNANTQASVGTCPTANPGTANIANAPSTCGTGTINACAAGQACVGGECLAPCATTDGSADNTVAAGCACGTTTVVKVAQNKVCTVTAAGVGSEIGQRCVKQDGTAANALANSAACSCGVSGANVVQVATNKVCRVVANKGYETNQVACSNTDGTTKVSATCTCGYGTTKADITFDANSDKFCKQGTTGNGFQFTAALAACAATDGSADNAVAAGCACGTTTIVKVAQNKVCTVTAAGVGSEIGQRCVKQDGTAANALANSAACSCGVSGANVVQVATNKVCRVVANKGYETNQVACSNTDGTTKVSATCTCGYKIQTADITFDANSDKFCYTAADGSGTQQTKAH